MQSCLCLLQSLLERVAVIVTLLNVPPSPWYWRCDLWWSGCSHPSPSAFWTPRESPWPLWLWKQTGSSRQRQPQRGKWFRLLEPEVMADVCNGKLIPPLNFRRNKFFHCGLDTINCCFQLFVTISWALMFCCFFWFFFFSFFGGGEAAYTSQTFFGHIPSYLDCPYPLFLSRAEMDNYAQVF